MVSYLDMTLLASILKFSIPYILVHRLYPYYFEQMRLIYIKEIFY